MDEDGDDGILLCGRISPVGNVSDMSHLTDRDMYHGSKLKWYCCSEVQT